MTNPTQTTTPEGADSAESIQFEAASPAEILRIRRARAVAKRSVMMDMAHLCDATSAAILATNPGRKRGSSSQIGIAMADVAKSLGDAIEALRARIEMP